MFEYPAYHRLSVSARFCFQRNLVYSTKQYYRERGKPDSHSTYCNTTYTALMPELIFRVPLKQPYRAQCSILYRSAATSAMCSTTQRSQHYAAHLDSKPDLFSTKYNICSTDARAKISRAPAAAKNSTTTVPHCTPRTSHECEVSHKTVQSVERCTL